MQTTLPVALSAQLATEKRLNTIADNIANARTVGFRATEVKFESYLSEPGEEPVAFVSSGKEFISTRSGELTQTGNALDMAVNGDAWFAVQGRNGPIYTRDGRMQMTDAGDLVSMNGDPVLDVGGAPLQLNPAAGKATIARDGMITQNGVQVGAVGLFRMPDGAKLARAGTSGVQPNQPAVPVVEFDGISVMQGFVEGANINPVLEMTRLIEVQRAFESAAKLSETSERALDDAVTQLGSKA